MVKALRWPEARWNPSPNFGYTSGGKAVVLSPRAYVQHSSVTPLNSPPPARFFSTGPGRGSVHLWYYGNGVVDQLVEFDKPAYGNGQLNRADGLQSPSPLVREWYATGRNPNWDTWSAEFTGYGHSHPPGYDYMRPTDDQMYAFVRFSEWSKAEGWLEFGPDTLLLHKDISSTACPDGRFDVPYLLNALEGQPMTPEERIKLDELWRRTGGDEGVDYDLLLSIRNQQNALTQHIENHTSNDAPTTFTITGGTLTVEEN